MQKKLTPSSLLLAITLIATLSLNSCSDFDNGFDEATIKYNQNFLDRYGPIDPNHDWGFGEIGSVDENATRTVSSNGGGIKTEGKSTRVSKVEQNELIRTDDAITRIERQFSEDIVAIPGFPGADGWYHVRLKNDRDKVRHFKSEEEIIECMQEMNKNGAGLTKGDLYPAGDVTDEEILYVSRWFRENKNPGNRISVNWGNFFFQSISRDYDREEKPVGSGKRHGNVMKSREIYEKKSFASDENAVWGKNENEPSVSFNMEQLKAKSQGDASFDRENSNLDLSGWDDINNFNKGEFITHFGDKENNDTNPDEQNADLHRFIMLFMESGTLDYAWKASDDSYWYNNWVLVNLDFDIDRDPNVECDLHPGTYCDKHHYDGLYLAFDYQYHYFDIQGTDLKISDYNPDGYYSNWILKLSAANPKVDKIPNKYEKYRRIMCEDLGNTNDFDFNDLVFDVYYTGTNNNYTAHITVQAVGGTLPIYIGHPNEGGTEAHGLLGGKMVNGKYTPIINKGANRIQAKEITIPNLPDTDPDHIDIYVANEGNKEAFKKIALPTNEGGQYENPGNNVPQKICVPYGTEWTNEHQQIETLFEGFREWVRSHENTFWKDEDLTPGTGTPDGGGTGSGSSGSGNTNTDLTWSDGKKEKGITLSVNTFKKIAYTGLEEHALKIGDEEYKDVSDNVIDYNKDIVDVIINNSNAQIMYIVGKKAGETTITFTQEGTGKTLTLNVTVEGGSGDGTTTADRPTWSYTISATGIDMVNDETTVFVDQEFTIAVTESQLKKECGFSFDAGGTGTTYEKDYDNDNSITTFKFKVGKVKGTATFTISLDGYQDGNTIYNPVNKTIKIHVKEPEGTELTIVESLKDNNGNVTGVIYNVSDLNDIVGKTTEKVTFTIVTDVDNYYTNLYTISDGQEARVDGFNGSGTRVNKITIEKSKLGNGQFKFVTNGITAVYVEKASSAKKRTIPRK